MQSPDQNVERNRQLLLDRSVAGLKKYGVTTERDDLTLNEWLQHLLEELLDAANYVQAAMNNAAPQTIHLGQHGQPGVTVEPCLMLGPDEEEVACLLFTAPGTEVRLTWPTQTQALAVLAAATGEHNAETITPPVSCECGDSYPLSSHGAGFIEGRGHCANCAAGSGEMASLLGVSPAPVAALVEALKELISAAQSVNCSRHHRVAVAADDAPCYWQRKEWVDWLVESGKSASAALAAYLKQQAPAESGGEA